MNLFQLPNKVYDVLKWIVVIVLPAFGSLYSGLADTWQLPLAVELSSTINYVCTFLGAVLCLSTISYNRSEVHE